MTDYEKVVDVFFSTIRQKYELPDDLVTQWFYMAVGDFELDIKPIYYDETTQIFGVYGANAAVINTLGLMMAKYYVKREQSRINKLNNIIGRDIQLNATGDAKKAVQAELENILFEIEQKLFKQKKHSFS